jgi:hypothetical protein
VIWLLGLAPVAAAAPLVRRFRRLAWGLAMLVANYVVQIRRGSR